GYRGAAVADPRGSRRPGLAGERSQPRLDDAPPGVARDLPCLLGYDAPCGAATMSIRDMALAWLTSVAWGLAFVAVKVALERFSAPQWRAVGFLVACLPVVLVPRPAISWTWLVLIGTTLFTGQFMLLFLAYTHGMPPGLASVTQQMQAFFTVLLAAVFLGDVP